MRRRTSSPARLATALAAALAAALIAGAAPAHALTVSPTPPGAVVEGAPITAAIATFTDGVALFGCAGPAQYTASIAWGDGTTTPGTISPGPVMLLGCAYLVAGAHAYVEEGPASYSVAVTAPTGTVDSGPAGISVRDAPLVATAFAFNAGQNTPSAPTVAAFTDANPAAQIGDLAARIAWGDGTSAGGTIAAAPGGGFAVTATHSYARTGAFTVSVAIKDAGGSQASADAVATVTASAPPGSRPPPPTGSPPPAGGPPSTTPPPKVGLSTPTLARGGTVVVGVRCPVSAKLCRGRLDVATLAAPHSAIGPLHAAQALGAMIFIIPGGRQAQLSVRPKRAVIALLRRAGSVQVSARATTFDASTGASRTASRTAKLKLVPGTR